MVRDDVVDETNNWLQTVHQFKERLIISLAGTSLQNQALRYLVNNVHFKEGVVLNSVQH